MRFMCSYQIAGQSGNRTFDSAPEMVAWVTNNRSQWQSYSLWFYTPDPSGISTLCPFDPLSR